jgi:hypothetical protein
MTANRYVSPLSAQRARDRHRYVLRDEPVPPVADAEHNAALRAFAPHHP